MLVWCVFLSSSVHAVLRLIALHRVAPDYSKVKVILEHRRRGKFTIHQSDGPGVAGRDDSSGHHLGEQDEGSIGSRLSFVSW